MSMNWAEDYQPIAFNWFMTGVDMIPSRIAQIYDVRTSTRASEYELGVEGTDIEGWENYKTNGVTAQADVNRGYPTTFTHYEYTRQFHLKIKDIEDDNLGLPMAGLRQLGISAAQRREAHAAGVFNRVVTAGYTGPDGVVLGSASHPYAPDNAATYSNLGTSAFSYTAVLAAQDAMRAWIDSAQNPLMRIGTLILHPVALSKTVREIVGATAKPGTANNDANAADGFSSIAWDYLSDANNWFLIDPVWSKQCLIWYDRVPLSNKIVTETTTDIVYEFRMRYSFGWTDPRFVYVSSVS